MVKIGDNDFFYLNTLNWKHISLLKNSRKGCVCYVDKNSNFTPERVIHKRFRSFNLVSQCLIEQIKVSV